MAKLLICVSLSALCAFAMTGCGGGVVAPPGAVPDFTIALNPGTVSGLAGGSTNPTAVSVSGLNGFAGNVIVSVSGLPPGATTSPAQPLALAAGSSQAVTISIPGNTAAGNIALTVTGTSGQLAHSAALVLSVGPTSGPDFSIAVNPATVTVSPGGASNPANISIQGSNGFSGNVSVSVSGLPAGATTAPAQPLSIAAGAAQALTISVPASTMTGSYSLTLTGTSGQLVHTAALVLNVSSSSPGSDQFIVAGHTNSANFPTTPGAWAPNALGGNDGTISSLQLSGGVVSSTFSTYFGGSGGEEIRDVFVDSQGNIYITGQTNSTNFPTTAGVFQRTCNSCSPTSSDGFVAVLSPTGQLLRATFFGGSGDDEGYNIFVDSGGVIYVGGRTSSVDYPVTGAQIPQRIYGGGTYDMHVTKFSADLSTILWATYLGGLNEDTGRGRLAVDSSGNVYMGGETRSNNFPGAVGQLQGGRDGVLVKLSPNGSLLYTRLIGGNEPANGPEGITGDLLVKSNGETYVCGFSSASDVPNVIRPFGGGQSDALIARLDPNGQILAITYLGGNGLEECEGLALDAGGNLVVATLTGSSAGFPTTPGAFQAGPQGGNDYGITKFSANLSTIVFSTFVGGSGNEDADTVRVGLDPNGNIYFAGHTTSSGLPWITVNAAQPTFGGGSHDMVLIVLSADGRQMLYASYLGGSGLEFARSLRYRRNP